jgi:5-methylcytosine-specific restriction endonuclease McrA
LDDPHYVARRHASTQVWREKNKKRILTASAAWRKRNLDKAREWNKSWIANNLERYRQKRCEWTSNNKEKIRASYRKWEAADPDRAAAVKRATRVNRRNRERENGGTCSAADIRYLFQTHNGRCANCRKKTDMTIDHIKPVAAGGTSKRSNLQLLCRTCNRRKSDKDPLVWAQENGRLL